jgi:hypothetical protein
MTPRPGGEADKIGNRYEGAWTVARLLDVLGGQAKSVRVEPLGDIGKGIEFVLERSSGDVEVHQVKRQAADSNEWNVGMLSRLGIWESVQRHASAGRDYHFVSMVPFRPLQELSERVRNSNDFDSFILASLPRGLDSLFAQIIGLYGDQRVTYQILRRLHVRLIDESELRNSNAVIAEWLLQGGTGSQARAVLGELVDDNIDVALTPERLLDALRPYSIQRRLAVSRQGLAERVRSQSAAWSARVAHQLIKPVIHREGADQLRAVPSASERVHFLVAAAGGGKTAVLHQALAGLLADEVPTLVIRLDRYGTLSSTTDLGRQLDLDVSPAAALAAAADGEPAVLVVDQLDAVSLASGRLPENFDVVADLVTEAAAIPGLHVILACRQFDVDNDHRIRSLRDRLEATVLTVVPLTDQQVNGAVAALGLSAEGLTQQQKDILRLPLHLALLATVAHETDALKFGNSQSLFDAFWEHKRQAARRRREGVRFGQVVGRLAEVISERQELAVPISLLDNEDLAEDAAVLVSEQFLVRDGSKIAFFHEAVFDYAFARQWVNRRQSIVDFLTAGEQELFRRGQVRQIMAHLRTVDPPRFVDEVRSFLTSDEVRFHVKDAALSVLASLDAPTSAEAELLLDVANTSPQVLSRIWSRLHPQTWFDRLDRDGHIAEWLGEEGDIQERALYLMSGVAKTAPNRLTELLAGHGNAVSYAVCLRWVARFADLGASRSLFDLVVDAVKRGYFDGHEHALWLTLHELPKKHPDWAVEVLGAFLVDRPGAMELNSSNQVAVLRGRDYHAAEFARTAAAGAPRPFCETILPFLLSVMKATAYGHESEGPIRDRHFSYRYPASTPDRDLESVLFTGVAAALRQLAGSSPTEIRPIIEQLASDPHDSAQWLLYQALAGNGEAYAGWAARLLLEGRHRLLCGYASNGVWATRQVLEAIQDHLSDELFGRIEDEIRDLVFSWEGRRPGWYAFTLLTAIDANRLSDVGRLRLGELQRSLGMDRPPEPEGVIGGSFRPPISGEAAGYMSDDNWLQAMTKHSGDREDYGNFTGGAHEQAQVLQEATKKDPSRFAGLALRITPDINPAYCDAILRGIGESEAIHDEDAVFKAVLHIASIGHVENDRWLGSALRPYLRTVPLVIVELIMDRLVTTSDPHDDGARIWSEDDNGQQSTDIEMSGINTARGSLAEAMADLLAFDPDGTRVAVVTPALNRLAEDPSIPVRTCVARLIGAAMRLAKPAATEAFWRLIETDDVLLGTGSVVRLVMFLGQQDPTAVGPVLERMLSSDIERVREAGGQLAVLAGTEWEVSDHLTRLLEGEDAAARKGAAGMAAHRLPHTANTAVAATTLETLFMDGSDEVRREAAQVADALRGQALRPFEGVLRALIASPAFADAASQLPLTLETAPDRVNALALLTAKRFVEVLGFEASDIRAGASADSRDVGQLIIRGLAQTRLADERAALLDVLDQLLFVGAYGIEELINEAER